MVDLSKVLVVGSNGLIGSEIDFGIKLNKEELNVLDINSIVSALDKYKPQTILNLASINIRACQNDPLLSTNVNVLGAYYLALEAEKREIGFIQLSSGSVFNGNIEDSFGEDAIPKPLNLYAQTKYLAEILVRKINKKSLVVRTGWLFGFRFKQNFFNKMIDAALSGQNIKATYDQSGSFTYVKDFVAELKELIKNNKYGIYNVVNEGRATALDLAESLVAKLKSKSKIDKTSIVDSEKEGILRSRSEVLVSNKVVMRNWRTALESYLEDNF